MVLSLLNMYAGIHEIKHAAALLAHQVTHTTEWVRRFSASGYTPSIAAVY